MKQLISFEEALQIVRGSVPYGQVEQVALPDAVGRILANSADAPEDVPRFDNAAMDGYAVRARDLTGPHPRLRVDGEIKAGDLPRPFLSPDTCIAIMTGAPLPGGADAVIPLEWSEAAEAGVVRMGRIPRPGLHVRRMGEVVHKGERILEAGEVITPPMVTLMAMLGMASVPVYAVPRVAILATGDELVDVSQSPCPGQVRDANGPGLAAHAKTTGAIVLPPTRTGDDPEQIHAAVEHSLASDVLIVTGGASVGKYDCVRQVLQEMGLDLLFWKVRQRPGKPMAFGMLGGRPVFSLPGNPTAAAVCFEMYVRPALARMQGFTANRRRHIAKLELPVAKRAGLHYVQYGSTRTDEHGSLLVEPTASKGAGRNGTLTKADSLIHLPETLKNPSAGTLVEIERLPWAA